MDARDVGREWRVNHKGTRLDEEIGRPGLHDPLVGGGRIHAWREQQVDRTSVKTLSVEDTVAAAVAVRFLLDASGRTQKESHVISRNQEGG